MDLSFFDPVDQQVKIWKTLAPLQQRAPRWDNHQPRQKYCCFLEMFGCFWIYDKEGLRYISKHTRENIAGQTRLDDINRTTPITLDTWLKHWNFWKSDYRTAYGQKDVLAFRADEYNADGWSSVCFVEQACIKLKVSVPPWPAKCNLALFTNRHKFNIVSPKEELYSVKIWRTSTIRVFGIPLHVILNKLNFLESTLCPPGAYHGYIEVYDRIWEYGPQGLICVDLYCSAPRKNAILIQSTYTNLKEEEWLMEWKNFQTNTLMKSDSYSMYECSCLTFLTYGVNVLGIKLPDPIHELTKWMRQYLWHGKFISIFGAHLFIPPMVWVIKFSFLLLSTALLIFVLNFTSKQ